MEGLCNQKSYGSLGHRKVYVITHKLSAFNVRPRQMDTVTYAIFNQKEVPVVYWIKGKLYAKNQCPALKGLPLEK